MKKITSLLTLICALFITTATAQVNQTIVFDFVTNPWGIPTQEATNFSGVRSETVLTDGTNTITINPTASSGNFYYDNDCLRLAKTGSKIVLPAFDFAVEKIEVVGSSKASSFKNADLNIFVGNTAVSTAVAGLTDSHVYEIAADNQAAGNVYELVVGSGGGAYSSVVFISYIKVYPAASDDALTLTAPVFDNGTGVYTEPVTVTISSPTTEIEGVENVVYYYTTDGYTPDQECDEIENGTITISESCTLKVVLEFTYKGETYTSEASTAEYIISEEVTYPKATIAASGKFFIVANGNMALPYNNNKLPTRTTTIANDNVSDAEYYLYSIETAEDGKFYIKDANGLYLTASSMSTKEELQTSTTYHNTAWSIDIEDGVAKIRKDGYVLVYKDNAINVMTESNATATEIYPSLYGTANPPAVLSYTPDTYTTEIKTVSITFTEDIKVEEITSSDQFPIYKNGTLFPVGAGDWYLYGSVLRITFQQPISEDGNYEIRIPAEYIASKLTGIKMTEDIKIGITIYHETSVEEIETETENTVIYDLSGKNIEQITGAGIYIINGKKVLIK